MLMITSGLTVEAADGLHDDNWCWPSTRLTLTSQIDATELRLGVWFMPEPAGSERTVVTVTSDKTSPNSHLVNLGTPTEIKVPMTWRTGEIISVQLLSPHRASKADGEKRDLSFCLLSIVAV